jgi:hypothetical protein
MNIIQEDKIEKITIQFTDNLTENYLRSFSFKLKEILKAMIAGRHLPLSVRGEKQKLEAFAKALDNERKYILILQDVNAADPRAMSQRHELENSMAEFEKQTGIKWPVR